MSDLTFLLTGKPHPMPWVKQKNRTEAQDKAYAKILMDRRESKSINKKLIIKSIESKLHSAEELSKAINLTPNWTRRLLREMVADGILIKEDGNNKSYWSLK